MNKLRKRILLTLAVMALLVAVFWWGGNAPSLRGWSTTNTPANMTTADALHNPADMAVPTAQSPIPTNPTELEPEQDSAPDEAEPHPADQSSETPDSGAGTSPTEAEPSTPVSGAAQTTPDRYQTDPVPEGKPSPLEPQQASPSETAYTCTLSVSCATVFENYAWLNPEKIELIPADGLIFPPTTVTFYEGESVFNLLQREMRKADIHLEFVNTPIFNSAYIEGINNLYEFDCGELSGWMYCVNGWYPNYGCSRYQIQADDVVEWIYTCDLGLDIGGDYAAGQQDE